MADPTQDWLPSGLLEAGATVLVAIVAGMGSAMAWFSHARRKIETNVQEYIMKQDAIDRRVLALEHANKTTAERLERIDKTLQDVNKKQDRQVELLVDIATNRTRRNYD